MVAAGNLSRVIFKLANKELSGEVTLTPATWRVLVQFDGVRTVAEIARALGMEESAVAQVADKLSRSGILQVATGGGGPARPTINGAFFDQLLAEFARVIGPLAEFTLEDEIGSMGESREGFPRDRIPELVERLSQAVPDEARRVKFQQIMLGAIRKI